MSTKIILFRLLSLGFFIFSISAVAKTAFDSDSTITNGDYTKTPYPRIAMLWAAVRGEQGVESTARHDLIMSGQGALGLKHNREPAGLANDFTAESI